MRNQNLPVEKPLFFCDDQYRLMLDSIPDSLILLDEHLRIVELNKAAKAGVWEMIGFKIYRGIYFTDLINSQQKTSITKICEDAFEGRQHKAEYIHYHSDGSKTSIENNFFPARNSNGDVVNIIVSSKEITEKKQAESAIKEAEERWRFALEAANQGAWDWNMQTNEVTFSDSYKRLYGFTDEDLKNHLSEWEARIHPEDRLRIKEAITDHVKSENSYHESTYRLQMKNGTYKWILARGKILSKQEDGTPLRMIGTHTDLTETHNAEKELRKMHDRFFYAAKASSHALWEWDALTGEAYVSPSFTELFGWAADADQRFEQWHQYVHPDEKNYIVDDYYRALKNPEKQTWQAEYRFLKADGDYATVADKAYILRDATHKVIKVIGATEDITAKKKTEHELHKSNERYNNMLKATNDLLWEWDIPNNFVYRAQEGLKKVYGISNDSSIKTFPDWLQHVHPDDKEKIETVYFNLHKASHQQTFEVEYRFKTDDGSYADIYDRAILLKDENDQPLRMIGATQNISQRKELEQEILNNELEYKKLINQATVDSQEQERSEIGRELHDNINQVLTTIKLYLELALSNEDIMKELVKKSSLNVSNLINEIRQLSRSLMDPTIGDLGIVDSIYDLVDNINLTQKIHISLEIDNTIENILDKNQKLTLFRIIQESLNNVIKHAKATFVTIYIACMKEEMNLVIKDDGVGFLHESVKKGAGLKNITNRLYLINGSFAIESAPGKGCSIHIKFPVQKII